ncbi:MAG: hypothetical protein H6969_01260 [Gammaproteobacteria bacterium]|nr:hypothetical protein [Gammaproteobacteria bacterium]
MGKVLNDDIINAWTESQKQLWDSFSNILPPGQSPPNLEAWRQAYLKNLSLWEATVKQTLTSEAALLEQWTKAIAQEKNLASPLGGLTHQVEGAMRHWLRSQAKIWDDCFALLRGGKLDRNAPNTDGPDPEDAWEEPETADSAETPESPDEIIEPAEPDLAIASVEPAASFPEDNLRTITGIGPTLEKKLNAQGITSYRQIAALSEAEIAHLESTVIRFTGRIRRDRWIEQAKAQHLAKYGESL